LIRAQLSRRAGGGPAHQHAVLVLDLAPEGFRLRLGQRVDPAQHLAVLVVADGDLHARRPPTPQAVCSKARSAGRNRQGPPAQAAALAAPGGGERRTHALFFLLFRTQRPAHALARRGSGFMQPGSAAAAGRAGGGRASYGEFSMRSPRSTSPRFSADGMILSGRQYGIE